MSFRPNMFATTGRDSSAIADSISGSSASVGYSVSSGEVDLREEYDDFVYGPSRDLSDGHGKICLHRRAVRDASGKVQYCTCKIASPGSHADPDCNHCYGEGFLYEEEYAIGYWQYSGPSGGQSRKLQRLNPGLVRTDLMVFYFRYDQNLKYGDKIVEVELDLEGNVIAGPVRKAIHRIENIAEMRSDHGRLEFYTVYVRESESIRPDEFGVDQ